MKSRIEKKDKNSSEIILSIGMIIKNEEKVLRRCLESIKPLMAEIKCELIIADTGSVDRSYEVAKEYTDNVFHFEWINDFAAARNSTLEKAKGKWYLFLDADEYFDEDIHEIVEFFKIPELYNHYKTASILVRSYKNKAKTIYYDSYLPRFQRIVKEDNVKFRGVVHETMYIRSPHGYFQTIVHHTGYCFESRQQFYKKKERNLLLMKEEYKNSEDKLRIISHILDLVVDDRNEAERYIKDALTILKKTSYDEPYRNILFMQIVDFYKDINPFYALDLCDEYFRNLENPKKYVVTIAIYRLKAEIYLRLCKYEDALSYYQEYIDLYRDYKDEKISVMDSTGSIVYGITPNEYIQGICDVSVCLKNLYRYSEALGYLNSLNIKTLGDFEFTKTCDVFFDICYSSNDYKNMAELYCEIYNTNNNDKVNIILTLLNNIYYNLDSEEKREQFAKELINTDIFSPYTEIMKIIINQKEENDLDNYINHFVESIPCWNNSYSEIIYIILKNNINMVSILNKIEVKYFDDIVNIISCNHDDYCRYVLDGITNNCLNEDIKQLKWKLSLYYGAVLNSYTLNEERKYELYNEFINILTDYVMNIYNVELLNEEDVTVLPDLHKFGYFMYTANMSLLTGDKVGYISQMKKALVSCESMKEIVQFLLEYFKTSI